MTQPHPSYHLFFLTLLSFFLSACGGSTTSSNVERNIEGKLIDSAVEGVEYRCGNVIDFTDENGTFSCATLPVSFYIGAINLGEVSVLPTDKQVFPQDIASVNRSDVNNTKVLNLALLLQSLDSDKNASNGINISSDTRTKFTKEIIVSDLNLTELKNQLKIQDQDITFQDINNVLNHLRLSAEIISNDDNHSTNLENNSSTDNNTTSSENNNSADNNSTDSENNNLADNNTTSSEDNNLTDNNTTSSEDNNSTDNNTTSSEDNNSADNNTIGSEDNNSADNVERNIQGKLIDSAVEGVEYRCGNVIDFTDENGTFSCATLPVSFYIGAINLGEVSVLPTDKQVFPQDIASVNRSDVNNTKVLNLALLLQSLDSDKNASNGINISSDTRTKFTKEIIVSDLNLTELKNQLKIQDQDITFQDINNVLNHLRLSAGIKNNDDNNSSNTGENVDNNNSEDTNTIETNNTVIDNTTPSSENNNSNENNTTDNSENNDSEGTNTTETNTTIIDNTAPLLPTLTSTPSFTAANSINVIVNGESHSNVYLNNVEVGTINAQGSLSLTLDTSGVDGTKNFNITLQDAANNTSSALSFNVIKDTVAPAENSTINSLTTADTSPPLSGSLPHGNDDNNTENYTISIEINGTSYEATNNEDNNWSLPNNTINPLEEGFYSVIITVTDEAGNSSSTTLTGKIEINNTAFLIDSALEGIKYKSGSYTGYTDVNGLFKYEEGTTVTFYIGDESTGIPMGSTQVKIDPHNSQRKIITIFDLAGSQDENNTRVINMGKFLQSLDADNDVSNGITIDEKTKESIALANLRNHLDFNEDVDAFHQNTEIYNLMNDLAGHFGEHRGLLDSEDVKAHLVSIRDNNPSTKTFSESETVRGEKQETKILTGVFQTTTGVVEGLEYRSGNQVGRTSSTGEFQYEEGKSIKFYIYQLELGTTEADSVLTPANLVVSTSFNHPKPRNIIRLLAVFDAISSDAKITIDDAVREALEKYRSQIDINLPDGKANEEFSIPAGVDEFGAQFDDFEIGKDILDEITLLRGAN
ncbi:MAG: MSHA biogenesis protein MshL [uncultured Sulfurovum sp.]|uniref:MSHA biogenesis protein MshL n=1 Tax=uncultured Sulfurovum sp. TaxID=269237 RepID=A0A6S6TSN5_9BACT|nr:MAG: MSHA biogenesis protein MshL [uncultured Sulfurovum sp.]